MMAQQQVFVTITMALIFTPKLWTLYKGVSGDSVAYSNHVMTITGRIKPSLAPTSAGYNGRSAAYTKSVGVQCNSDDYLSRSNVKDNNPKQSLSNTQPQSPADMVSLHPGSFALMQIDGNINHLSTNA